MLSHAISEYIYCTPDPGSGSVTSSHIGVYGQITYPSSALGSPIISTVIGGVVSSNSSQVIVIESSPVSSA